MKKIIGLMLLFLCIFKVNTYAVDENIGYNAYVHILNFSSIGNRSLVSESEINARKYIVDQLKKFGYKPKLIKFKVNGYETYNIEVNKKGKNKSETIIVGAHYDGRNEGNACDDNGSGISVLLELCELLNHVETPYNIKFVFFGAEEINVLGRGLHGSYDYVESLSKREKNKIKYMVNLDTLVSGDNMYVYNAYKEEIPNEYSKSLLEKVREISENLNIHLKFNPNEQKGVSFTNTKSDYYPFFEHKIPVLYFESTNWDAGEKDGRSQSKLLGRVIHSKMDNINFLENVFNSRVKDRLKSYVELVKEVICSEF